MNIRKYKIVYQTFNFFKRSQLKYNIPQYKKYGLKKKYFSSISSDDFRNLESPLNVYDSKDSDVKMPTNEDFNSLESNTKTSLLSWSKNGYSILCNFFSEQEMDLCNEEIRNLIEKKKVKFRNANKIMFAFHHSDIIRSIGLNEKLLKILNVIMGKKVELFQSINFLEGSQQRTHSDSIHMTTFPFGNIIAVWIALEDITAESGPLHYYPGSHKLPYTMNRDYNNLGTRYKLGAKNYTDYEDCIGGIITENKLKKEVFIAKKGDILIWHANLLHGGEKVLDENSTRKSMVLHFYSEDSICFHEITQRPTLKPKLTKPKLH
jgi:ectoine hydroxylase-related dioxygenase (phytanoyl-CoA dioxygenase family)